MVNCKDCIYFPECSGRPYDDSGCKYFKDRERFAYFPCKIGDPVWFIGTTNANRLSLGVIETTVEKLVLKAGGTYMKLACNAMYETSCRSIGKTVFYTREAAEKALAERRK